VADEYIQRAPVFEVVDQQARQHPKCPQVGFFLGVLIRPIGAVAYASAKAADQGVFVINSLQVQIDAAFGARAHIQRVILGVVVAWHVIERHVQHGDDIFKIGVG